MQGKDIKNKWNGTPSDLMEIVKGLCESGLVQGNQTEIFNDLCQLLNVPPANPKDLIKGIRRRKKQKFKAVSDMLNSLQDWDKRLDRQNKILQYYRGKV